MKHFISSIAVLVGLSIGTSAWADNHYPGDGITFPPNYTVVNITEYDINEQQGVYYNPAAAPGQTLAILNSWQRCNNPVDVQHCINTYRRWNTCPIVQRNALESPFPMDVKLRIEAAQSNYFPGYSYPEEARWNRSLSVKVDYLLNTAPFGQTPHWVPQQKIATIPANQWGWSYMYPNVDRVAVYRSLGPYDQILNLRTYSGDLTSFRTEGEVKDMRVSFCDFEFNEFLLTSLEIAVQDAP